MTINELQQEILRIKRERGFYILAHVYQGQEILEIADATGDSYALAVKASQAGAERFIMCGVKFMAETVKLLNPDKRVYLANPEAGCPMADGLSYDRLKKAQERYPNAATVCYINTTAEVKTISDVCVTSSSAVDIIRKMPEKEILFVPDCNLGAYVQSQVPEKEFHLISGGCPIHAQITAEDVRTAKALHPNAVLAVHPECQPEVCELADYIGSTTGIMNYAKDVDNSEVIIGTEISIVEHLQFERPDKRFYPLSKKLMCHNMKLTTLADVYNCLAGDAEEITLAPEVITTANLCIEKMIELG
jgi:quinolinate synthase